MDKKSGVFSDVIVSGVGLLGGAIGLAVKRTGAADRMIGLGRNPSKLERAQRIGALDLWTTSWRDALELSAKSSDPSKPVQIVFCAPVEVNLRALEEFWALRNEPCLAGRRVIVSDVGSVKTGFVDAVKRLRNSLDGSENCSIEFVPAHPIAGSDRSGAEYATRDLFEGKLLVLAPWLTAAERREALESGAAVPFSFPEELVEVEEFKLLRKKYSLDPEGLSAKISTTVGTDSASRAVATVREFWRRIGSLVVETSAEEHDRMLGRTSHLPHLMSVLTMNAAPVDELLFSGTGLFDVTRLSGGEPGVWVEIFGTNRLAVLEALETVEENVRRWKTFLAEDDRESVLTFLQETKKKRDALGS